MLQNLRSRHVLPATGALLLTALLAGCGTAPAPRASLPAPSAPVAVQPVQPLPPMGPVSTADSAIDYRLDAAYHLYEKNNTRIFKA